MDASIRVLIETIWRTGDILLSLLKIKGDYMIVDGGVSKLLTQQLTYLGTLRWGLFVNNVSIIETTTFASLTEASWTGYARANPGVWGAPALTTPRQVTVPGGVSSFINSSGSAVNFYGWFVIDPSDSTLIAAVNLGLQTIPNGGSFTLAPSCTDREE